PVMLEVPPVAMHRIAPNSANVIVSAQLGAREALQNDAEPSSRDVEAARLDPYPFGIRNPETVVLHVDVRNEVVAAALIRTEAIGEAVKGSDRHVRSPLASQRVRIENPFRLRDGTGPSTASRLAAYSRSRLKAAPHTPGGA